jgi:hypothetical protein
LTGFWQKRNTERLREELEEREKLLLRDRSTDPKLEDLEKRLADRQAENPTI